MPDITEPGAAASPWLRILKRALVLLLLLTAILATRLYTYVIFHTLAEMASIVVGICVFIIAWHSVRLHENSFLLVLGVGSLFVALVDALHTLTYSGIGGALPEYDANLPTQLWLIARFLQALTFVAAPFFAARRIPRARPLLLFGALTALLLAALFGLRIFPEAYAAGKGLTPFKVASEYSIIAILIAAGLLLWRKRDRFDPFVVYCLLTSMGLSLMSEFAFTLYFGTTDTTNLLGHLLKIAAYYFIYLALVETAFTRPYDLLFYGLKRSEQTAHEELNRAELQLHKSERRYRELVNSALIGVGQRNLDGTVLFANAELGRIFNAASVKDLIGTNLKVRYKNPQDEARLRETLQRDHKIRNFETEIITRDNQSRHVLMSAWVDDDVVSSTFLDITALKQADFELQRQVRRLKSLMAINSAIINSTNLPLVFDIILEQVISTLAVDAADVLLFNRVSNMLEFAASRGFRTGGIEKTQLRIGDGYAGRSLLRQKTLFTSNLAHPEEPFTRAALVEGEDFIFHSATPLLAKGETVGVLEIFHRQSFQPDQSWLTYLEALAGQASIAIESSRLVRSLQRSNLELEIAYDTTLEGWTKALELRDKETEGHTMRVTELTVALARKAGVSEQELIQVRRGALLHDIGKIGIPDAILRKHGQLTDEEWTIMRRHPSFAYEMLYPIEYLRPCLAIPYSHHEKWDGSGYPQGLKGEQIPLAARLFAVVDVWDALTNDRIYRAAMPREDVVRYIRQKSGTYFDPAVVELFLQMVAEQSATG